MLDYLIVGSGLAGLAVAETLRGRDRSFLVLDHAGPSASRVAAGLYNPVVLKRLNLTWKGEQLMRISLPFYRRLQQELGIQADHPLPLLRLLHAPAEQNAWVEASDRPGLSTFLIPERLPNDNPHMLAPHGFGEVRDAGWMDTSLLLNTWAEQLTSKGLLKRRRFEHRELAWKDSYWEYEGIQARRVVFCEGFGMMQNPYFNYLPLQGTKGEYLTIHAPGLDEKRIIKSSVFVIPLGNDRYRVGATYTWNDYEAIPTAAAREELLKKLGSFLRCPFTVEGQSAGIRPTVPDRRPLAGQHPEHPTLCVLNGLGSRGVLLAPFAADQLVRAVEDGTSLPGEMDISRFIKRFERKG